MIVESPDEGEEDRRLPRRRLRRRGQRRAHPRPARRRRELPAEEKKGRFGKFAVDVDAGFEPFYVVDADKKKKVAELKRALKDADELLLATDEDREGEAIAWHLLEVLQPKVPVRRMVFHEITREAIRARWRRPATSTSSLVDAQETRRILDRLYGYEVSPVLWRKVRAGLSAGRVQSVATRLVVERERERIAFRAAEYWDIEATFEPAAAGDGPAVRRAAGQRRRPRVATGRDFGRDGQPSAGRRRRSSTRPTARGARRRRCEGRRSPSGRWRRSPTAARPPRRSSPRRCSRRPAASCG